MDGSRWLNQRSRHCLPMRPGSSAAMTLHLMFPTPWARTMSETMRSSSSVQGPLCRPGRSTLFQRCRHCTSDLTGPRSSATFFQFFAPCCSTMARSLSSSSRDHLPPIGGRRAGFSWGSSRKGEKPIPPGNQGCCPITGGMGSVGDTCSTLTRPRLGAPLLFSCLEEEPATDEPRGMSAARPLRRAWAGDMRWSGRFSRRMDISAAALLMIESTSWDAGPRFTAGALGEGLVKASLLEGGGGGPGSRTPPSMSALSRRDSGLVQGLSALAPTRAEPPAEGPCLRQTLSRAAQRARGRGPLESQGEAR
mmetsp:Transcript_10265/g.29298  ORF Transcript_10265/g.29298 Transcript_10265/m.29298 type:complete len:307 (-) Transcript_10265:9-929(-)